MKLFWWVASGLVITILVLLILFAVNSELAGKKWLLVNTRFGPVQVNSAKQVEHLIQGLGITKGAVVVFQNQAVDNSKGSYVVWNPPKMFGGKTIAGCKKTGFLGINLVQVNIDIKTVEQMGLKSRVDDYLPGFMTGCLGQSLLDDKTVLGDTERITGLVAGARGMMTVR